MTSKRAIRRHHRQRMIRQARVKLAGMSQEAIDRLACRLADNMKACSCRACTVYWQSHADDRKEFDMHEQISEAHLTESSFEFVDPLEHPKFGNLLEDSFMWWLDLECESWESKADDE
jgi:hypothetical protein